MRIHHVALRTANLEALSLFYREVLGLPVVRSQPGYSEWLGLGDGSVLMIEKAAPGEPSPSPTSEELVAFAVSITERESVVARLTARGVAIEAATEHTRYFRDPEGRRLAVSTYPLPRDPIDDPKSGIRQR